MSKTAILINDTSYETHIGSRSVVESFDYLCNKYKIKVLQKYTRAQCKEEITKIIPMFDQVDLILINGEGSLHHHPRTSTAFFPLLMKYIKKRHTVVLLNALWQDMDYSRLARDLGKIDLISVRESYSYNELAKQYPTKQLMITPDLIFHNEFKREDRDIIGYGDSVDKKIRSSFKRKVNYFPLNFIHSGTYKNPTSLNYPSLQTYITWLESLDLYVTGRFHGVCLSAIAGTPFLVYPSNSHKIEGMLHDMNCSELLIRRKGDIQRKTQLAIEALPKIKKYAKEAKIEIEELFKRIVSL